MMNAQVKPLQPQYETPPITAYAVPMQALQPMQMMHQQQPGMMQMQPGMQMQAMPLQAYAMPTTPMNTMNMAQQIPQMSAPGQQTMASRWGDALFVELQFHPVEMCGFEAKNAYAVYESSKNPEVRVGSFSQNPLRSSQRLIINSLTSLRSN